MCSTLRTWKAFTNQDNFLHSTSPGPQEGKRKHMQEQEREQPRQRTKNKSKNNAPSSATHGSDENYHWAPLTWWANPGDPSEMHHLGDHAKQPGRLPNQSVFQFPDFQNGTIRCVWDRDRFSLITVYSCQTLEMVRIQSMNNTQSAMINSGKPQCKTWSSSIMFPQFSIVNRYLSHSQTIYCFLYSNQSFIKW